MHSIVWGGGRDRVCGSSVGAFGGNGGAGCNGEDGGVWREGVGAAEVGEVLCVATLGPLEGRLDEPGAPGPGVSDQASFEDPGGSGWDPPI